MTENARSRTRVAAASIGGVLTALCCCSAVRADCIATVHSKQEKPIYEVVSCGPAAPVVESLRESSPAKFGEFSYSQGDVALVVTAVNSDARKLMRKQTEYWYYPAGCAGISKGARFVRPKLNEQCCDVWPIHNLPCGVGGKQLMSLEGRNDA